MKPLWLILIPLMSAVSGWLLFSISLKMILSGSSVLSLKNRLTSRVDELTGLLAEFIGIHVLNNPHFAHLTGPAAFVKLSPQIELHIDQFLRIKLKEQMPVIASLIGERTTAQLKQVFMTELQSLFPEVMSLYLKNMKDDEELKPMISNILETILSKDLHTIVTKNGGGLLLRLKIFGAAGGFVFGIIQLLILLMIM